MERLHHIIQDAVNDGSWEPIYLSHGGPGISHLFFADDLMLFGEASTVQVDTMLQCIQHFCAASGQKINLQKTKIYFSKGVHFTRQMEMSSRMGVGLTGDLGKYLGVPLIHKRATI